MADYTQMWKSLDMDLELHEQLLAGLGSLFQSVYLTQKDTPSGMDYFYNVIGEIHGARIRELVDLKESGKPIVGTFCIFVPEELIVGAGGACVGLCGGADFSVGFAESDLPRNICPLIKSAYGFKKSRTCPYMQVSDFIYGETTCEAKKKTWEQLNQLHPTHVMHIPHMKRDRDLALWLDELRDFKKHLEQVMGETISADQIRKGIRIVNEKRSAMKRLETIRKNVVVPISGLDALLIEQISFYDDPVRFTRQLNALCDELEERVTQGVSVAPEDAPRIMVAGTPMAPPNWKLHHIVETAGGIVVNEESCIGNRYYKDNVALTDDMDEDQLLTAMLNRYAAIDCACFTPNDERVEKILKLAGETRSAGVVQYALSFCHTYNIESGKVGTALKDAGIPTLSIETDYSSEDEGQIRTRVEAFLEQIRG